MSSNHQLRREIRQQRRALSPLDRQRLSLQLCNHISRDRHYRRAKHIALYLANDGEVDVTPIIRQAWSHGKHVYLPVLALRHTGKLWFVPYRPGDSLYWNRFGIAEPVHPKHERYQPIRQLDLIILPLVGFDHHGHRLGMGGGYYDRTLIHRSHHQQHWFRPYCLGAAYSLQELPALEAQPWDVALDAIATEHGIRTFR